MVLKIAKQPCFYESSSMSQLWKANSAREKHRDVTAGRPSLEEAEVTEKMKGNSTPPRLPPAPGIFLLFFLLNASTVSFISTLFLKPHFVTRLSLLMDPSVPLILSSMSWHLIFAAIGCRARGESNTCPGGKTTWRQHQQWGCVRSGMRR